MEYMEDYHLNSTSKNRNSNIDQLDHQKNLGIPIFQVSA